MTPLRVQSRLIEALVMDRGLEWAARIVEDRGGDVMSYNKRASVAKIAALIRGHKQADKIRKEHPDA